MSVPIFAVNIVIKYQSQNVQHVSLTYSTDFSNSTIRYINFPISFTVMNVRVMKDFETARGLIETIKSKYDESTLNTFQIDESELEEFYNIFWNNNQLEEGEKLLDVRNNEASYYIREQSVFNAITKVSKRYNSSHIDKVRLLSIELQLRVSVIQFIQTYLNNYYSENELSDIIFHWLKTYELLDIFTYIDDITYSNKNTIFLVLVNSFLIPLGYILKRRGNRYHITKV